MSLWCNSNRSCSMLKSWDNLTMAIVKWTVCLTSLWVLSHGYNIDLVHPLIFSDPNNAPSYFGYKVQYHVTQGIGTVNAITSVLIGAPKANATYPEDIRRNAKEPGRLYRCAVNTKGEKCEELVVDGGFGCCDKEQGVYPYGVKDDKNYGWLGGTLAVQSPMQGRIVVCGHLLKNTMYSKSYRKVTGGCHFSNHTIRPTKNFVKIVPLDHYDKDLYQSFGDYYGFYRFGMAGFDVHFSTQPSMGPQELIIGAPGVIDWSGTIIRYRDSDTVKVHKNRVRIHAKYDDGHDFSDDLVPDTRNTPLLRWTSHNYFGYSVFSGKFKRNTKSYVGGAPRGSELRGRVLIFQFGKDESASLEIEQELHGSQLGEYFGASLLALDLNKDGIDELLVGAPSHTYTEGKSFDDGRVYLFTSLHGRLQKSELEISGSQAPGGHFGSAIISAGDLNQDAYNDILVGAPYENENRGAVYLYHGSSNGLKQNYAQRIGAEQFEPSGLSFRGFGIHMTSFDIDGNMYPDVLIGSYLSGHAVILRSYPIIHFQLNLMAMPNQVLRMDQPLTIMACVGYRAPKPIPAKLCASFTMLLDVHYNFGSRLKFTGPQAINADKYIFNQTLEANQPICTNVTTKFIQGKFDNSRPLTVELSAELLDNQLEAPRNTPMCTKLHPKEPGSRKINMGTKSSGADNFCSTCPVVDKSYQTAIKIPFAGACGDRACVADLEVQSRFIAISNVTDFVLGSHKRIGIETTILNHGELASAAGLMFHLPKNVTLARMPPKCGKLPDKSKVECELGNGMLGENETEQISFFVDLSAVSLETQSLAFYSEVTTKSDLKQSKFTHNATLSINLHVIADVTVLGHVVRDQLTYDRPNDSFSCSTSVPFSHQYEISKYHASPLDLIQFEFDVPVNLIVGGECITIIELHEPLATQDKNPLSCKGPFTSRSTESSFQKPDKVKEIDEFEEVEEEVVRERRDVTSGQTQHKSRAKRGHDYPEVLARTAQQNVTFDNQTRNVPLNRTSFFNCSMPNVRCARVTCDAASIENGTQITVILKASINIQALWPYVDKREIIMISSMGHVKILKPEKAQQPINHKPDAATASTWFHPNQAQAEDKIPLWIPIASGIGGLLILLLIGNILARCGFFKRKKYDRMQQETQKSAEEQQDIQPTDEQNTSEEFEFEARHEQ